MMDTCGLITYRLNGLAAVLGATGLEASRGEEQKGRLMGGGTPAAIVPPATVTLASCCPLFDFAMVFQRVRKYYLL